MKVFTYIKNDSARVEKKNFQLIGHLPLWKHLLYEISDFDIFVDTDSGEIIRECKLDPMLKNVTAYARKQEFVDMENDIENKLSPSLLMTHNFLDKYVTDMDEQIVLTHVTSPFLERNTLRVALRQMKVEKYEFAHSVHTVQDFAWLGSKYKPINFNPKVVQRTQDVDKIHFSNGAFFCFTKRSFKKYNNRFASQPENNLFCQLNRIESIEIDTKEDLELARVVYKGIKKND